MSLITPEISTTLESQPREIRKICSIHFIFPSGFQDPPSQTPAARLRLRSTTWSVWFVPTVLDERAAGVIMKVGRERLSPSAMGTCEPGQVLTEAALSNRLPCAWGDSLSCPQQPLRPRFLPRNRVFCFSGSTRLASTPTTTKS